MKKKEKMKENIEEGEELEGKKIEGEEMIILAYSVGYDYS